MQSEKHWREHIYRGNVPQLTVRAVVVGMLIGALMCLSNLYVFLKTGWSMGVTITAAILAFAAFRLMAAARLAKTPLSALENNALTTVSSGAGYMTGGGNMAAFVLLLVPGTVTLGALLALGVIAGAIVSHLTRLGIVVMDDGGLLFVLALAVFAGSAAILVLRRREIPIVGDRF